MTDDLGRNTAWVAMGQTAVKLSQIVIAATLVQIVAAEVWNDIAKVLTIYVLGTAVGGLNAHQGIIFFVPRVGPARTRSLVQRTMLLILGLGLIAATATVVAAAVTDGVGLRWSLLALAIALELPSGCVSTALITLRQFPAAAAWDIAGTAAVIAGTVVAAVFGHGPDGVAAALAIVGAGRLTAGAVTVRRLVPGGQRVDRTTVLHLVRYGLPLAATITVSMLNRVIDKWLIAWFDPSNFGIYAVAAQEIPLLSVLPYAGGAALATALVDAFRDGDLAAARSHWLHLTMRMSAFVAPLALGITVVAPDVLTAVFTPDFRPAVVSFQIFTIISVHRVAEYGMLLRAAGRTREVVHVAVATLVANTVLAGVGAALWGMTGASLGTAGATLLGWWLALRRIADALEVPVRHAFPWTPWAAHVVIATMAAVAADVAVDRIAVRLGLGGAVRTGLVVVLFTALVLAAVRWWHTHPGSVGPTARYVAHDVQRRRDDRWAVDPDPGEPQPVGAVR